MPETSIITESEWKYPPTEANRSGFVKMAGTPTHNIHWQEHGNLSGEPVMYLHGGPGGGLNPVYSRFFDPERYRIILFSQRGCGQNTPNASDFDPTPALTNNTTADLINDINSLRDELGIKGKMHVFGGSWGSTLALAYAIENPEKTQDLILRGIFLSRRRELDYFYQGNATTYDEPVNAKSPEGAYKTFPEAWKHFVEAIPAELRGDMVKAYANIFNMTPQNPAEKAMQDAAARAWTVWEGSTSNLIPPDTLGKFDDIEFAKRFAKIENHYFMNGSFLGQKSGEGNRDNNYILENIEKIKNIPTYIVHGLHDQVCPHFQAEELMDALKKAYARQFQLITTNAGHSWNERANALALTDIMDILPKMTTLDRTDTAKKDKSIG